jgi:hypothetical protein
MNKFKEYFDYVPLSRMFEEKIGLVEKTKRSRRSFSKRKDFKLLFAIITNRIPGRVLTESITKSKKIFKLAGFLQMKKKYYSYLLTPFKEIPSKLIKYIPPYAIELMSSTSFIKFLETQYDLADQWEFRLNFLESLNVRYHDVTLNNSSLFDFIKQHKTIFAPFIEYRTFNIFNSDQLFHKAILKLNQHQIIIFSKGTDRQTQLILEYIFLEGSKLNGVFNQEFFYALLFYLSQVAESDYRKSYLSEYLSDLSKPVSLNRGIIHFINMILQQFNSSDAFIIELLNNNLLTFDTILDEIFYDFSKELSLRLVQILCTQSENNISEIFSIAIDRLHDMYNPTNRDKIYCIVDYVIQSQLVSKNIIIDVTDLVLLFNYDNFTHHLKQLATHSDPVIKNALEVETRDRQHEEISIFLLVFFLLVWIVFFIYYMSG